MLSELAAAGFWLDLAEITGINILLSGDNAVVIALACRSLPTRQRNRAVIGGSAGAILLRVLLCLIVVSLLQIPYLKLIGGLLLLWIGVKLIVPEANERRRPDREGQPVGRGPDDHHRRCGDVARQRRGDRRGGAGQRAADRARPADQHPADRVRQPAGAEILLRFPLLVTLGGGLLGWIAGEIISGDPALLAGSPRIPICWK